MISRKYVGDYRLENVPDRKGRLRTVPVYQGPVFRFTAAPQALRNTKIRCAALAAIGTAALLGTLLSPAAILRRWYARVPLVLCAPTMAEVWAGVIGLLGAGKALTREQRDKMAPRIVGWGLATAILAALSLSGQAAAYVTGSGPDGVPVTACTAALCAAALGLFCAKGALRTEELPPE